MAESTVESEHVSHKHACASLGYPCHKPSTSCICVHCGDRFDGRPLPDQSRLIALAKEAERLRVAHNAIPWWKTFKRQDAAADYRWALYMAALEEIKVGPIRVAGGSEES